MVLNQASLKRDGVQDYVSLRATAIILTLYTFFILGFFLITPEVTYDVWKALFSNLLVKAFTLLALVCIAVHTKIGLWQVMVMSRATHRSDRRSQRLKPTSVVVADKNSALTFRI